MKHFLLVTHRWLGLISGIFLLVIGGSGSILVYRHAIDRFLHPALFRFDTAGARLPFDSLYAIVYARHAEEFTSLSLDIPSHPDEPVEFTLSSRAGNLNIRHYIMDLHPYTGAIVREGDCGNFSTSPVHWLMYLHDGAHFGNYGLLVVAVCPVTACLSALTGLLFYGRKIISVLTFSVPLRGLNAGMFLRSLHVYVAVWSLLFAIVVFFTGFWMVKGIFTGARWQREEVRESERLQVSLDSCLARSRNALPGFSPDFADIPLRGGGTIEIDGGTDEAAFFDGGDASSVTFDPRTGAILATADERNASFPANITPAFWALHTGRFAGPFVRFLYAIFGIVPGVLAISGFVMYCTTR